MVKLQKSLSSFISNSPEQTKKLGEVLALEIQRTKLTNRAMIIGLRGDLGGGKTTFLQGLAKGLGIKVKVLSPTFIILKKFKLSTRIDTNIAFQNFYHIDCYRLHNTREIFELGLEDLISNPRNIIAIEWIDLIKPKLARNIMVKFDFIDNTTRKITLQT